MQAPVLLTQQHVLAKVTLATQSKVVLVDRSWDEISRQPTTSLNIPADVTRLMYMIFTSGMLPLPLFHHSLVQWLEQSRSLLLFFQLWFLHGLQPTR